MEADYDVIPKPTKKFEFDLKTLLSVDDDDEPPPELVIVTNTTTTTTSSPASTSNFADDRLQRRRDRRGKGGGEEEEDKNSGKSEELVGLTDHQLEEAIQRQTTIQGRGFNLPDGGAKARNYLERLRAEKERRRLLRLQQEAEEREEHVQTLRTGLKPDEAIEVDPQPNSSAQSEFACLFAQKIEENNDSTVGDPFDEDFSLLSPCDKRKRNHFGQFSKQGREKNGSSRRGRGRERGRGNTSFISQQISFEPRSFSSENENHISSNGDRTVRSSLNLGRAMQSLKEKLSRACKKSNGYQDLSPDASKSKKEKTVILDDEEDLQIAEKQEDAEEVTPSFNGATIYYPSREDPQAIEIHYSDLQCLTPQAYLTSPIMNFYIQILQGPSSPTDTASSTYHFFNTYFYKKLQDAVSNQKSDKEAFFVKFRRWWKGVNIFQKAYILLPIHESLHWSLAIICIPDEKDESGPIVLHLDSLGYHSSELIFDNIKRFLKEEWNFLNNDLGPVDVPIAERIWKNLPRRIELKKIMVPQQKNDYDCGLFVLYFMERFIEEAPQRLKKSDLAMFGNRWFRPEEASSLRGKIKHMLLSEFRKSEGEKQKQEPACSPSGSDRATSSEHIDIF